LDQHILQSRIIYCAIVAGKSAKVADESTERLWKLLELDPEGGRTPFSAIRCLGSAEALEGLLRQAKTGNYRRLAQCFWRLSQSDIDLTSCSPEALEEFPGIGRKTSRFFILWTRPGADYAALDTHILQWMKREGYEVTNRTPKTAGSYYRLERAFVAEARRRGMTPRELDWEIWSRSSKYQGNIQAQE
jgi:endonuclease III